MDDVKIKTVGFLQRLTSVTVSLAPTPAPVVTKSPSTPAHVFMVMPGIAAI